MSDVKVKFGAEDENLISTLLRVQKELKKSEVTAVSFDESLKKNGLGAFSGELQMVRSNVSKFTDSMATAGKAKAIFSSLAAGATGAGAAVAVFAGATKAALSVLQSYAEFDGLVRGLKTIEGTAADTQNRLEILRDVAKMPGLGFEEAVKGDIRLRSVGFSAKQSELILRSFGNAIATVGGGAADLDGVILALGQIQSKGKISTEEINQLAERVPQVRIAIKDAFGTADIEALAKTTLTTTQFVDGLTASIGKLPKVTGGAQNTLDNYNDSWKFLKNSASEFALGISTTWINSVSSAFAQAGRDLKSIQALFGMATPGLYGEDAAGKDVQAYRKAREDRLAIAKDFAEKERKLEEDNATFWTRLAVESNEYKKKNLEDYEAKQNASRERQKVQQKVFEAAMLSNEQILRNRLAEIQKESDRDAYNFKKTTDETVREAIRGRVLEAIQIEKQLVQIEIDKADAAAAYQEKMDDILISALAKVQAVKDQIEAQTLAIKNFEVEGDILDSLNMGHNLKAEKLERQRQIEALKLQLMADQGLQQDEALRKAEERITQEERLLGIQKKGIANEQESQKSRRERRSQADKDAEKELGNTDRLAAADFERRKAKKAADDERRRASEEYFNNQRKSLGQEKILTEEVGKELGRMTDQYGKILDLSKENNKELQEQLKLTTKILENDIKKDDGADKTNKDGNATLEAIRTAVDVIRTLVAKIEPKLPQTALSN